MKEVAIIADSIGCIPGDMIEAYGIEIVAPNIYSNGAVYRDWIDITPGQAYDILRKDPGAFSTAPPSPGDLARTYRRAGRTARSLLCITVSARASTLHDVAVAARELVRDDLPGTPVEVLDSGTCTGARRLSSNRSSPIIRTGPKRISSGSPPRLNLTPNTRLQKR